MKQEIYFKLNLYHKYSNMKELLYNEAMLMIHSGFRKLLYVCNINQLLNLNILEMTLAEKKKKAIEIFDIYHKSNTFINHNFEIIVNHEDIRESISKIVSDKRQSEYLFEHLTIFAMLGTIIENAKLVSQGNELKNRLNYIAWHYYVIGLDINNNKFMLEFEVVTRSDNENHYRVQRLVNLDKLKK